MHRADARARQHRNRQLRTHAHVDGHAIARLDAQRLQDIGALADFAQQLLIGVGADLARLAFPNDGGFIFPPGLDVAVQAVVRKIQLATQKPLCPRNFPFHNFVPRLEPMQLARNVGPKSLRIGRSLGTDLVVLFFTANVSVLAELLRRRKAARFGKDGVDIWAGCLWGCGHRETPPIKADDCCANAECRLLPAV